ncbi:uncharacterized protein [Onthophagus taurus]|uniref:uncharacterized protein n=1 Tax=Onthophagus taurus TaxID=166361 RepID=UPI0039BDDC4A
MHVNHVLKVCIGGVNLMRSLASTKWGGDPLILSTLYKAIIRSRLEYGLWIMMPLPVVTMSSLQRIAYQAYRLILGALRSSPTNALTIEAGETSLETRAKLLGTRFAVRSVSRVGGMWNDKINKLIITYENLQGSRAPLIIGIYKNIRPYIDYIYKDRDLGVHSLVYETRQWRPIVKRIPGAMSRKGTCTEQNNIIRAEVENYVKEEWSASHQFYTDGSIRKERGESVACGIYSPTMALEEHIHVPEQLSIFGAEAFAVSLAIRVCLERGITKAAILTDSLSTVEAIKEFSFKTRTHPYVLEIIELLHRAHTRGLEIHLAWIPGHTGIKGNEKADQLAAMGHGDEIIDIEIPGEDIFRILQRNIQQEWESEWKTTSKLKGINYAKIQPSIQKSIPFTGILTQN